MGVGELIFHPRISAPALCSPQAPLLIFISEWRLPYVITSGAKPREITRYKAFSWIPLENLYLIGTNPTYQEGDRISFGSR